MTFLRMLVLGALLLGGTPLLAADFRAVTLINEPYSFLVGDKPAGMSIELLQEIARRLHKKVRVDILPWARALQECERGSADIILNALRTPERELYLDYVPTPITSEEAVLIVPQHSRLHFDGDLDALRGRTIGASRGFRFGDPLDKAFTSGQLLREDHDSVAIMLKKLSVGRLEVGVVDKVLGAYEISQLGLASQLKILQPSITHVPSYFAVSRKGKAAAWAAEMDRVLKQMQKDGSYAKIRARYGVSE